MMKHHPSFLFILCLSLSFWGKAPAAPLPPTPAQPSVAVDTVDYDPATAYPNQLLVIRPLHAEGPLPCIIYVPGSAWKRQDMSGAVRSMIPMAERGYVVACAEYRPCSEALFPAQVEDSKTATRYMRAHAEEYSVDPDRIYAWGSSSGGHTVLLHALTQDARLMDSGRLGEWSCKVAAVVDYYGPSELVREFRIENGYQRDPDANGGLLLGDPVWEKRDVALKASPLYYVHPYAVPLLIVHGDGDRVVPLDQSDDLARRYRECGARCSYLVLPGEGHGTAGFWTPQAYDRVDAFLRGLESGRE